MTPAGAPLVVSILTRRQRRAMVLQRFQHAIPAVPLAYAGAQSLAHGASGSELALAIAELTTSLLLFISILGVLRHAATPSSDAHHHGAIDWADVWAASVLFAEAWEHWHIRHHVARPTILLAAITLILGLFHGRLANRTLRKPALTITDEQLTLGGVRWRRFQAPWAQISNITITDTEARISSTTGKSRRIRFPALDNATEVRAALEDARRRLERSRE